MPMLSQSMYALSKVRTASWKSMLRKVAHTGKLTFLDPLILSHFLIFCLDPLPPCHTSKNDQIWRKYELETIIPNITILSLFWSTHCPSRLTYFLNYPWPYIVFNLILIFVFNCSTILSLFWSTHYPIRVTYFLNDPWPYIVFNLILIFVFDCRVSKCQELEVYVWFMN